ncbi:MAG: TatD family hydrolase, partial [Phycisphaerae bacterium]|nr:TatD family hydrolase [Phycisphaerae bacterium]
RFFQTQLQLASERGLPVVIHNREATDDTLGVLKDFPKVRGVFHCFTGTCDEAKKILEAGFWLGFTGVVTFKKSDELREACRLTPMDRLLVETDAPWLSPEPVRKQKVNEPAFVMHTARAVAEVRGVSVEEINEGTTENARELFGWPGVLRASLK